MKILSTRAGRFAAACLALLNLVGICQPLQAREGISLAWALQQTLANNPQLAAYPYYLRRAEGLKQQAGLRPLPTIGLTAENLLGNGNYQATDRLETTLTLSQTIELGGKRQQRLAYADARLRQQEAEYELTRLDVLAETSRRYYQVLRLQALQHWLPRRARLEQQALDTIRQRAEAGAVGNADVAKMELRLARSQALREQLSGELALAKTRLAVMWLGSADFGVASGDLSRLPPLPDKATVLAALDEAPRILLQLAAQHLADANLQLSRANGRSDLELGLGIRRFEVTDDEALTVSFSMPLAWHNPNEGRIAAAGASRELTYRQSEANNALLESTLLEAWQILDNQQLRAQRLSQTLVPLAHALLEDIERGYQLGRYSVLQWADAQAELFTMERELIETGTRIYLQLLELERLSGQPMTPIGQGEV